MMSSLIDLKQEADLLSEEDRLGLAPHLLATVVASLGADDAEFLQQAKPQ